MRTFCRCCLFVLLANCLAAKSSLAAEAFELADGDRVVLLGSTFIERDARDGFIEAALSQQWPDRNVTFRNLGWSGDTVWAEARSYFGPPAEGFDRLRKQLGELKPTVAVVCYGAVESFAGSKGLPAFVAQYEVLLGELEAAGIRIVLLSPPPHEKLGPPLPDPAPHNRDLLAYSQAIGEIASKRGHQFVDLFRLIAAEQVHSGPHWTDNGVHLTEFGYFKTASLLSQSLFDRGGNSATDFTTYRSRTKALREAINAKNQLYFHRWRPQNETYLFGFRKHEQGNNAIEIPQFDPLVEEAEKAIAKLRLIRS